MRWAEGQAAPGKQDAYPEEISFHDFERARKTYNLLRAFSDGWGAWKFMDVLGKPLIDLDEPLVDDLLTLRYLAGIAEEQAKDKDDGK